MFSIFLKCVFFGSIVCSMSYSYVKKYTDYTSAQCVDGGKEGREVIDLASAPTPWHSK